MTTRVSSEQLSCIKTHITIEGMGGKGCSRERPRLADVMPSELMNIFDQAEWMNVIYPQLNDVAKTYGGSWATIAYRASTGSIFIVSVLFLFLKGLVFGKERVLFNNAFLFLALVPMVLIILMDVRVDTILRNVLNRLNERYAAKGVTFQLVLYAKAFNRGRKILVQSSTQRISV